MTFTFANRASLLLTAAVLALSCILYRWLPEAVPSHWDGAGSIDGTTPKPLGAFQGPLAMALVALVFRVLPRISPAGYGMARFESSFALLQLSMVGFLAVVTASALLVSVGLAIPLGPVTSLALAGLLAVLAAQTPKLQRNFFVGIRTPWALTDDRNWQLTHRLAGRLFVAVAVLAAASALAPIPDMALVGGLVLAVAAAAAYSFLLSRRAAT